MEKVWNTRLVHATPAPGWGRVRDAADCLRKGVWVHIGVGTAEHIFDREGMTSVVFPRLGYYTHR